jgi:predicted enzyme related to lactoylglutathione lyase
MITGVHAILFSKEAEQARGFFRDALGLASVDAGGGWPIFALPPAELGVHPTDRDPSVELYLQCDDLEATIRELGARGVTFTGPAAERSWGRVTYLEVPGGGKIGLYEPTHPTAIDLPD